MAQHNVEQTRLKTIPLPTQGPNAQPTTIATAPTVPMRVLVRNVGGTDVLLGINAGDVVSNGGPTPDTYILPTGQSDVFVLAPRQTILGLGIGPGAIVTVALSGALVAL
jgi:hypothetical protein